MSKSGGIDLERVNNSEYIGVSIIAQKKYLNISKRAIQDMCNKGIFKSAYKPGTQGRTSAWKVLRSEIIQHRINGHAARW